MRYEYKVIPAPTKPRKGPRIKGADAKFAYSLEVVMNEHASDGWEYQRADLLPSEERRGLRSSQTVYRTVLVFRRALHEVHVSELNTPAPTVPEPEAPTPTTASNEEDAMHVSAQEKKSRFSIIGPARRSEDPAAPPLSAPHVADEVVKEGDTEAGIETGTNASEDQR